MTNDRQGLGKTGEWLFAVRGDNGEAIFAVPLKYDHNAAFNRKIPKERTDVPITQAMLGNEIIMEHMPDYRNVPVIASTRYLSGIDWGLVAKIDSSEVDRLITDTNIALFGEGILIMLASIIIGILLSQRISAPIDLLIDHIRKVGSGKLDDRIRPAGWQEAKELMQTFNNMTTSINETQKHLNEMVEEKTKELTDANKKLEQLSNEDDLTGLYNRRYFQKSLTNEFERAKRYNTNFALIILDLDYFKRVNDNYGHAAGDAVLKTVSDYMKRNFRYSDVIARIGGEEFAIIFPTTIGKESEIYSIFERMRLEVANLVTRFDGQSITITSSIGIAMYSPDVSNANDLFKMADEALYTAKDAGRNTVKLFSTPDSTAGKTENKD